MAVEAFLDTNVLIYAAAGRDDETRRQAAFDCIAAANFGTSGQVLAEFYTNVTRKPAVPLSAAEALEWIGRLSEFPVVPVTSDLVQMAIGLSVRHKVSYWDAAVIAAAEEIGAKTLFTEDLNDGQIYGSVRVVNPFKIH